MTNYSDAKLKALITIGSHKKTVLERVQKTKGVAGLDIVGLVVSTAHDAYEMYVRPDSIQEEIVGPFLVICDCVAKSFIKGENGLYRIVTAQQLAS